MLTFSQAVLGAFFATLVITGLGRARVRRGSGRASGFHWGEERFPVDFGFRFGRPALGELRRPAHPSGFRWKDAG